MIFADLADHVGEDVRALAASTQVSFWNTSIWSFNAGCAPFLCKALLQCFNVSAFKRQSMCLSMIRVPRTLYSMTWDRLLLSTEGRCRLDVVLRQLQDRKYGQFPVRPLTCMRCFQHWGSVSSAPRQQYGCERWAIGAQRYHGTRVYSGGPAGGESEFNILLSTTLDSGRRFEE